jgi:hypothetical protein
MKRWGLLAALALSLVVAGANSAQAQKKTMPGMKADKPSMAQGAGLKVTGPVKGAPTGKNFVVAVPRKGPINVDGSKAKFRMKGKFASPSQLRAGAMVTVTGMMNGTTMMASDVDIKSLPGGSTPPKPDMPGGAAGLGGHMKKK